MQVKSLRIGSGAYRTDPSQTAVIRAVSDQHKIELEEEIKSLAKTLETSRMEADKDIEASFQQGMQSGYQQGLEEGKESVQPAIDLMKDLMVDVEASVSKVWDDCRAGVTNIVLALNRKIIGTAASEYSELAKDITGKLLTMVRDQTKVTVIVNPNDASVLREAKADLMAMTEGVKNLEIIERLTVAKGGVLIETNAGQLDARLEEQLSAIEAMLKPEWSQPGENGRGNENMDSGE